MKNGKYEDFVINYYKHYVHTPRSLREAGINPYSVEYDRTGVGFIKSILNLLTDVSKLWR